ncbi:MAG: methyltransferase [Bacteroidia bacterium]|nr:methyltransferase [Bacteroidia bacterium]
MFESVRPYISDGTLLEIGSGIGNISSLFIQNGYEISLSDIRTHYCEALEKRFQSKSELKGVHNIDLVDPDFEIKHANIIGTFDNIFALNVIEHIQNDFKALNNIHKLLRPGGRFIMLVPAYERIYNRFDKELYHYRRYNRSSASKLFTHTGMEVKKTYYFNAAGILGWVFFGGILKNRMIKRTEVTAYDTFVPIFKVLDRLLLNKIGLSVVVVGEKKS